MMYKYSPNELLGSQVNTVELTQTWGNKLYSSK